VTRMARLPATPRMMPLPSIRLTFGSVWCGMCFECTGTYWTERLDMIPESIERSAMVDKIN
jgi:hypothetical protein